MYLCGRFDISQANVDDHHVDLGSGDGRLNLFAVAEYDVATSTGYEIDPHLVHESKVLITYETIGAYNISCSQSLRSCLCGDFIGFARPAMKNVG